MRLPAIVLAVLITSATLWAQALAGYVGATAPATGFAAKPPLTIRMPHKQLSSQLAGTRCSRPQKVQAECPRRNKDGSFTRQLNLSKQEPSSQKKDNAAKKITDPGAITIQR